MVIVTARSPSGVANSTRHCPAALGAGAAATLAHAHTMPSIHVNATRHLIARLLRNGLLLDGNRIYNQEFGIKNS
jgi:hypothetical protein